MDICWGMQVNKPVDRQWNTILHMVLSSLVVFKYVVDHDLYILQKSLTIKFW